jgi:rubrerythrin
VTEAERIWSEKSDEHLLEAAADLEQFTADGQRIIRAELKRRGLEDPLEQAGDDEAEREAALLDSDTAEQAAGWSRVRGLRSLVELSDSFDVYVCPQCGHVDLFAQMAVEEEKPE